MNATSRCSRCGTEMPGNLSDHNHGIVHWYIRPESMHFILAAIILAPLATVHASDSLEPVAIREALEFHDRALLNRGTSKKTFPISWLSVGLWGYLWAQETPAGEQGAEAPAFRDEPQARVLYDKMIEALRQPQTLSYKSEYRWEARGDEIGRCTYMVWLKKPNYFRVEAARSDGRWAGTIVGDGDTLWLFWAGDRPHFSVEDQDSYEQTRSRVYMKKPAPLAGHSIGHEVEPLGAGMSMPIINPSVFHVGREQLQPYLDGVMGMGVEEVGGQPCDVIEVSFMKRQRSWYLWLSRKDHLPRKLRQIIRVAFDITMHETWSDIVIDGDIPTEKFVWTPPEGWREWEMPRPEDSLLKPGTPAPDFDLLGADGSRIQLSECREKIVWLYIWRAGCPPCREGMRHIQKFHEKYRDDGLIILGFNCSDDKAIALEFMRENGVTFPTILDSSEAANQTGFRDYRASGVPLNYIIDRDGKVVDAWYGNLKNHKRALAAIEKAGLKIEQQ